MNPSSARLSGTGISSYSTDNPLNILGINAWHADASVALVRDGELVVALESERFRRIKHWAGFPTVAIQEALDYAGLDGRDIDIVAIGRKPSAHFARKAWYAMRFLPKRAILDRARNAAHVTNMNDALREALRLNKGEDVKVRLVEHHMAHLASAFLVSPFEESAIASIDGMGDFVSTMTAAGKGTSITPIDHVFFPHSVGFLYTAITQYLGFDGYGDEFKIMGLAPYGKPEFKAEIAKLIHLKNDGTFELDLKFFTHARQGVTMEWDGGYPTIGRLFTNELEKLLGPKRQKDEPVNEKHEAIASSVQAVYEDVAFHVLQALHKKTSSKNICLAGGCAMNSVANGKIREQTPFENVYVQPARHVSCGRSGPRGGLHHRGAAC